MKVCSVIDCETEVHTKGLCGVHYRQMRKHGRILDRCEYDGNHPLRKCRKCGVVQPVEEYRKNSESRGGRIWNCNTCENIRIGYWRNNTPRGKANMRLSTIRKYGITNEQYDAMYEAQGGVCAICGGISSNGRLLAVDHNHTTGQVRELLCSQCNTAIGALNEDVERMTKAIEYIKRWEAVVG